jgi:hypothetical protein
MHESAEPQRWARVQDLQNQPKLPVKWKSGESGAVDLGTDFVEASSGAVEHFLQF